MRSGTFYGIGVGPGDPELLTVKGAMVLRKCRNIFAPTARISSESAALGIARRHLREDAQVRELHFPMSTREEVLEKAWKESADQIIPCLEQGEDACFLTLGDPLLYSTYIYLLRALKKRLPHVHAVTIPGVTSFSAAAALVHFPIGEGKSPVTIVPTSDDLGAVERSLETGGAVVLMKIANRLEGILELLKKKNLLTQAFLVSRAGQAGERIVTDLSRINGEEDPKIGYLSVILVQAGSGNGSFGKEKA